MKWIAWLMSICAACAIVSPLEDIKRTEEPVVRCRGKSCVDGGSPPPADAGTMRAAMSCEGVRCDAGAAKVEAPMSKAPSVAPDASAITTGLRREYESCDDAADCLEGLFCNASSKTCAKHCREDADCRASAACLKPLDAPQSELGVCQRRCERGRDEPCTGSERCMTLHAEVQLHEPGDYCWVPSATCETNGACEEPEGTGLCLEGTDAIDCCRPKMGRPCDPVKLCGCERQPDTECRFVSATGEVACMPKAGTLEREAGCDDDDSARRCKAGALCRTGACRQLCETHADCGGTPNLCFKSDDAMGLELPYGGCMKTCDFDAERPCADGLVCARFSRPLSYCVIPMRDCTSQVGNGMCDDPRPGGTRLCEMGTDPDCM